MHQRESLTATVREDRESATETTLVPLSGTKGEKLSDVRILGSSYALRPSVTTRRGKPSRLQGGIGSSESA